MDNATVRVFNTVIYFVYTRLNSLFLGADTL